MSVESVRQHRQITFKINDSTMNTYTRGKTYWYHRWRVSIGRHNVHTDTGSCRGAVHVLAVPATQRFQFVIKIR